MKNEFINYLQTTSDPENLKDDLNLYGKSMLEVIEEFIKFRSTLYPSISKQLSCLIHNIERLEKDYEVTLMPHQVTDIFWCNFVIYLTENGLKPSSIKNLSSRLKTILTWAAKHGAKIHSSYELVKIPEYNGQQISLTPDEVSHIYHFNIKKLILRRPQYLNHLERVRDMFVLSCNLGQRFSDMIRISPDHFNKNIFTIVQQKTGTKAVVDIDRFSIDKKTTYRILEKYNYYSPLHGSGIDISCYNKYLKQLLKYIGEEMNEEVKIDTKIQGEIRSEFIPKWKLIGSHTSRRTFATVNIIKGIKESEVRRATGHKSESSFERYICYSSD